MAETFECELTNTDENPVEVIVEYNVVGWKEVEIVGVYGAIGECGPDITDAFCETELKWAENAIINSIKDWRPERDIDRPDYAPPREK